MVGTRFGQMPFPEPMNIIQLRAIVHALTPEEKKPEKPKRMTREQLERLANAK
jgi:hypothetical protein